MKFQPLRYASTYGPYVPYFDVHRQNSSVYIGMYIDVYHDGYRPQRLWEQTYRERRIRL